MKTSLKTKIIFPVVVCIGALLTTVFVFIQIQKGSNEGRPQGRFFPPHLQQRRTFSQSQETQYEFSVTSVIPAVVKTYCYNEGSLQENIGSGTSLYYKNEHFILTNAHVVRVGGQDPKDGCYVYFPSTEGTFYESGYYSTDIRFYDNKSTLVDGYQVGGPNLAEGGMDLAFIKLTGPMIEEDGTQYPDLRTRKFPDIQTIVKNTCLEDRAPEIGEKLFVIGYPKIGGDDITVTEGIVSGFEGPLQEYIKTSAKIEQGHSGGLAVLAEDGCPLGIPSFSTSGIIESIGRILRFDFIFQFLSALD